MLFAHAKAHLATWLIELVLAFCNIEIHLIVILIFAKTIICYENVTFLKLLFTNSLPDSSPLEKTDKWLSRLSEKFKYS